MKITIPDIIIPLIRMIRTKEEKDILRDQITMLEATLFRPESEDFENILKTKLPKHVAAAMRDILSQPQLKESPTAIKDFFQNVLNLLQMHFCGS